MTDKNYCKSHESHMTLLTEIKSDVKWIKKIFSIITVSILIPLFLGIITYSVTTFSKDAKASSNEVNK